MLLGQDNVMFPFLTITVSNSTFMIDKCGLKRVQVNTSCYRYSKAQNYLVNNYSLKTYCGKK